MADMEYSLPGLSALADGARLDARVKFAQQLMLSPNFDVLVKLVHRPEDQSLEAFDRVAHVALTLADAFYANAKARGWVKSLSTEGTPSPTEIAHVKMNAEAQVIGQAHGQKFAQEYQQKHAPRVLSPVLRPGTPAN